jgi:glycosyltransferase involved in cell wall biosynthesis
MSSIRIGIDCTAAVRQGAGIGRYTRHLVDALTQLDVENQYVLLVARGGISRPQPWLEVVASRRHVRVVSLPLSDRAMAVLWHRLGLPLWAEWFCGALDVFHSPDFTLPPVLRARTALTVHDLSFVRVPESADPALRSYLLRVVPASVRRADAVLADSQSTRSDVIECIGADPARVEVVYPGVEPRFRPLEDAHALQAVRSRYGLPDRFMLGLGTLQPRKNYERLIEAYGMTRREVRAQVKLVIAGGKGWLYDSIFRRVEELGVAADVRFAGYVADEDLPALYTLAELFVFPSLYEGFGLPPLEAMACGTPVVTSNVSSLPEVVGEAALLVDALDVLALAEAIQRALSDEGLRSRMTHLGRQQARRFTWPGAAKKLLDLYGRLAISARQ